MVFKHSNIQYTSKQLFISPKIQVLITNAWCTNHWRNHYSWLKLARAEAYSVPYHRAVCKNQKLHHRCLLHYSVLNTPLGWSFLRTSTSSFVKTDTNVFIFLLKVTLYYEISKQHSIAKILWKTMKVVSGKILDIAEMKITSLIFDF